MANQKYHEWLQAKNHKVSPEQYAFHKGMVHELVPLLKKFKQFVSHHERSGASFEAGAIFTSDEVKDLWAAYRILEGIGVPLGLLDIVEDTSRDDLLDLLDKKAAMRYEGRTRLRRHEARCEVGVASPEGPAPVWGVGVRGRCG